MRELSMDDLRWVAGGLPTSGAPGEVIYENGIPYVYEGGQWIEAIVVTAPDIDNYTPPEFIWPEIDETDPTFIPVGDSPVNVNVTLDLNKFFEQTRGFLSIDFLKLGLNWNESKYAQQGVGYDHMTKFTVYRGVDIWQSNAPNNTYHRLFMDIDKDGKVDAEATQTPDGHWAIDYTMDGEADMIQ